MTQVATANLSGAAARHRSPHIASETDTAAAVVHPPFHPDTLGGGATEGGATAPRLGDVQLVFATDEAFVLAVPAEALAHVPRSGLHVQRLTLCAKHLAHACTKGPRCKFVHTRLSTEALDALPHTEAHVNFAYTHVERATYARFAPGTEVAVVGRNKRREVTSPVALDSAALLRTRCLDDGVNAHAGADTTARVLELCRDFSLRRVCPRGAACPHAHVVYTTARAQAGQRAPACDSVTWVVAFAGVPAVPDAASDAGAPLVELQPTRRERDALAMEAHDSPAADWCGTAGVSATTPGRSHACAIPELPPAAVLSDSPCWVARLTQAEPVGAHACATRRPTAVPRRAYPFVHDPYRATPRSHAL